MSMKSLGESFDLHGGGLDLVFPHHENELAQSECATGKCFSRHWMHNGFVQINKEKMSKSLGNFFRLGEAFDKVEPESVRYSLLSVHYRSPFNLEMDLDDAGHLLGFPQFSDAERRLEYLYSTLKKFREIGEKKIKDTPGGVPEDIAHFEERLVKVLDDDLNTAQALGHLAGLLKAVNEICDGTQGKNGSVCRATYEAAGQALDLAGSVLGLGLDDPTAFLARVRDRRAASQGIERQWVEDCLARRDEARKNKDYAAADAVRDELSQKGVEMLDTPTGTTWRLSR
jgi:cysteinyl-tRNA synthetase